MACKVEVVENHVTGIITGKVKPVKSFATDIVASKVESGKEIYNCHYGW